MLIQLFAVHWEEVISAAVFDLGVWRCISFGGESSTCGTSCSICHQEWMWLLCHRKAWANIPGPCYSNVALFLWSL